MRPILLAAFALLASCGGGDGPNDEGPFPDDVVVRMRNLDATQYRLWEGTYDPIADAWSYQLVWNPTIVGPSQVYTETKISLVDTSATAKHYLLLYNMNQNLIMASTEFTKAPGPIVLGVQLAGATVQFIAPPPIIP